MELSIYEPDVLRAEMEKVREQGWARDDQEFTTGVACIAAPAYDHEGKTIAALTASGPAERVNEELDCIVEQVIARAASISSEIGYRRS